MYSKYRDATQTFRVMIFLTKILCISLARKQNSLIIKLSHVRVKRRLFCAREQNNLCQTTEEACRNPLGWASEQPPRMLKRATSFIASLWIGLGRSVQPERACSADCSALARASTDLLHLCALLFRRPWAGKLPFSQLHCLRRAAEAARPRRP